MSPRSMALAYRIWCDCQAKGWDRTLAEIADSLAEDPARVRRVAQVKDWLVMCRAGACALITTQEVARIESRPGSSKRF